MPRKRDRTTSKASWTVEMLERAIQTLRKGGKSVFKVAKETGIPYSTLKKRYKLAKAGNDTYNCPPKLGRHAVFNDDQEKKLADHLRTMSNMYYGLTKSQFRKICYDLAVKFSVAKRFNEVNKTAGKDWLYGFLQRHPDISIRKPEATSLNRILGFSQVEVNRFFENLEAVMLKYKFEAENIYNVDETGVTTVPMTEKIIAPKGQKRVGSMISWERGKNVTVICAMSASGLFIPPLFIFPRQCPSSQLENDGQLGAIYACSRNGWTNENIFVLWLKHFIKHSKPTAEKPILLIMDTHDSHCTLEAWELVKSNNIIMLTIPPHSSHRLQPLDVTFFGPLKRAYNKERDLNIKSKSMVKITPYEIASLFNKAYSRVANLDKGISGFKTTGIFPMNPAVFRDEDFVNTVDVEQSASVNFDVIVQSTSNETQSLPVIQKPVTADSSTNHSASNEAQQQPNYQLPTTVEQYEKFQPGSTSVFASALSVLSPKPLPQISTRMKKRRKESSEILTSTPMKAVFEEKEKKRQKTKSLK